VRGPLKISEAVAGEQVSVAVLGHPLGAREMTLPCAPCAVWFAIRIDVQHDTRDFGPIGREAQIHRVRGSQVDDELAKMKAELGTGTAPAPKQLEGEEAT